MLKVVLLILSSLPGHWSSIATRLTTTFCGGGYNGPFREVGTPWISGRWVGGIVESSQLNIHISYRHIFTASQAELHRLCVNLQGGQRRLVMGLGAKGKGVKPLMDGKSKKPMKNNCDALVLSNDGIVLNV